MNQQSETIEIGGVELKEGMTLWRYAALRTWEQKIGDQPPDEVIYETAKALVENYPEAVNNAPVHIVKANLKGTPGIYDHTDLMNYHAMEVERISTSHGSTEITIKDWKEEKTYAFRDPEYEDPPEGGYTTFEPLSALKEHLGVTILPVTGENDE